ncbi:probable RNA helicase SDE3 isoform X3 [Argentina anserina]|uniref:probable RNA helicase SDE3 isoform X3 n=1 Tax=Argentina anserina TaxID=57926 RepID=UPI0021769109|nr:probable RNA helicase SDE3 isoform X3 [Potentilla anserina]
MSGCFEFLRCLLCCADEPDCIRSSSHYTRKHVHIDTADDEEASFAPSRYYTDSPRISHLPTSSTSTSTSTSFQPHYHYGDFFPSLLRSPYSSLASTYKPPPVSQHFPSYTTSSTIKPSSSSPKKAPQSSSLSSPKVTPSSPSPKKPPLSSSLSSPKVTPSSPSPKKPPLSSSLSSPKVTPSSSSPKKPPQFSSLSSPKITPSSSSPKKPPLSSSLSSLKVTPSSSSPKKPPQSSSLSSPKVTPSSSSPKKPPQSSSLSSPKVTPSSSSPKKPPQSSSLSSPKVPPVYKSILSPASSSSNVTTQHQRDGKKTAYVCVEEDSLPVFMIPEDIKALIKDEIVPKVLNNPLSPKTYKDYFAALLYTEDFYTEKWSDFLLEDVTLELDETAIYKNKKKEDKTFVAFELESVREKRPYLLSRDLVFARPVGKSTAEPFQGFIYRSVRSKRVLVEFEDGFYSKHHSNTKYDVSFSFNRVCLKRAHQAVKDASDALFQNFLFPDCDSRASISTAPPLLSTTCHELDQDQRSAVGHILRSHGSPPYVVTGPVCVPEGKSFAYLGEPSRTGVVVSEAVYQLYLKSSKHRIIICAPTNSCCDVLMRSLVKVIPESTMFRANSAFREKDEVPEDTLRSSLYKQSCFSCPPIKKLKKYRVIFSTFMSSFRLHDKGIAAGHFSHIFLVDASSAIEPETLVALTNFADKTTSVVVTGRPGYSPRRVRSDIARKKGLQVSYFERICKRSPYRSLSPMFITQLDLKKSDSEYQARTS